MGRNRRRNVRADQRVAAQHREALERRFEGRVEDDPGLKTLVTARDTGRAPYHRWLHYVQGFSPELVRRFLAENRRLTGPILDVFSGSGTVVTECALQGRTAVGVEAVPALAFLNAARFLGPPPPWEGLPDHLGFSELRACSKHPAHLAAILFAASATVDAEGHLRSLQATPSEMVRTRLQWMSEDARTPLRGRGAIICADARRLPFKDAVFGGALTSPPYLSRYDYAKITAPIEALFGRRGRRASRRHQLRAAPVLGRGQSRKDLHPAVEEAVSAFQVQADQQAARLVRAYFHDLASVVAEIHRVLRPGAPLWMVIGGAELRRVYVPSDLILAEMAAGSGFAIESVVQARRLRQSGRHLGTLRDVAPRETLLLLRRRSRN